MTRQLLIYRTTFTDTYDGLLVDPRTSMEAISCEPDEYDREDGVTAADLAARYLRDESITSPSQHPIPAVEHAGGLWFSYVDGSYVSNYYTGEQTESSAHPQGFTNAEVRAIADRVIA